MAKIWVTKHNGSQQVYDQSKVINALKNSGIQDDRIPVILFEIEKTLYPGIATNEIYKKLHQEIAQKVSQTDAQFFRAREGLAKVGSFVFEKLISEILTTQGYNCTWNVMVPGFCIEHQTDVVATKGDQKLFVEVKHHRNEHRDTGLGDAVETWGRIMDIRESANPESKSFTGAVLVVNTKFSQHAIKFAACRRVQLLGWRYCSLIGQENDLGLEKMLADLGKEKVVEMMKNIV